MKKDAWGFVFAAVSAVAGIAYLINANKPQQSPTTNVFPPLNTDSGGTAADDNVIPPATPTTVGVNQQTYKKTPYPVFSV